MVASIVPWMRNLDIFRRRKQEIEKQ